MTIGEVISRIKSSNKYLFDDNLISDRFVYSIAKSTASLLVKQEINKRKLLNSDNVFTAIECLNLKETDLTECGINSCNKVRRSNDKLPKLEEGLYNYTIQGVYNIDNSEEIYFTTTREYINLSKLRFKPNKIYYTIKNGYIYVLDNDIENINIYIYSPDDSFLQGDCDYIYDAEFKFPTYLEDNLFSIIDNKLINYHKFGKDITDNNLEEQQ